MQHQHLTPQRRLASVILQYWSAGSEHMSTYTHVHKFLRASGLEGLSFPHSQPHQQPVTVAT